MTIAHYESVEKYIGLEPVAFQIFHTLMSSVRYNRVRIEQVDHFLREALLIVS